MAINKVIFGGSTLIDLTGDTVEQSKVLSGYTFHGKSGAQLTGSCAYDANTSDGTANSSEILDSKTAYVAGSKVVGSMTNNGGVTGTISTVSGSYTIPTGFHDGSGKVKIDTSEQAKIVAGNIKSGVTILGVLGNYAGSSVSAGSKSATPSTSAQTILPTPEYDYLSEVVVASIPYTETLNASGGYTATIG